MCMLKKGEGNLPKEGEDSRICEEEILAKIFAVLEREQLISTAEKIRILKKTGGFF